MRKWSTGVLVAVILIAIVFGVLHRRHDAPQTITGIGAMLGMRDHTLQIMGVRPDSPAAKAGLHRGMIIQQIDSVDITGKPLVTCVGMIRGPVGSKVRLEVFDAAKSETNIVEVTRQEFSLPGGKDPKAAPLAP
jgi:C-terminal processing protease CtpA/Prc